MIVWVIDLCLALVCKKIALVSVYKSVAIAADATASKQASHLIIFLPQACWLQLFCLSANMPNEFHNKPFGIALWTVIYSDFRAGSSCHDVVGFSEDSVPVSADNTPFI